MAQAPESQNASELWHQVCAAVKYRDPARLEKWLNHFRAKSYRTRIDEKAHVFDANKEGNTFALAMELLEHSRPGTKNLQEMVQILTRDWKEKARGDFSHMVLRREPDNDFTRHIEAIICKGEPERIRLALNLCTDYLAEPTQHSTNDHDTWLFAAARLDESRAECIKALSPIDCKPWQIVPVVRIILRNNTNENIGLEYPPLDKETLQALWSLQKQNNHQDPENKNQLEIAHALLLYRPAKSLLDVMGIAPEELTVDHLAVAHLHEYVEGTYKAPDPARLAAEPEYKAVHEDIRRGVLQSYALMRHKHFQRSTHDLSQKDFDCKALAITTLGLKQRLNEYASAPAMPETQHVREEIQYYQKMGLLPDIFTLAGPATGYTTDLEYKTTLREQIIPLLATPADRAQVLGTVCWAEYVRTKPIERQGSAAANYAMGG